MIELLVYFLIFVIVAVVVWYLLSLVPLPEPLRTIVIAAVVVIGAIIVIMILLSFVHGGLALHIP